MIQEKARMQQKHDTASNWRHVNEFVPRAGEIVVYDKDENTTRQSIKIGDGESVIGELPFLSGEIYVSNKMPENAGENAVWIIPDGSSGMTQWAGEAIAYMYRGVQLPPLPNWDKQACPYAYILRSSNNSNTYKFIYQNKPLEPVYSDSNRLLQGYKIDTATELHVCVAKASDTNWELAESTTINYSFGPEFLLWSNVDIMDAFSTYEPFPITDLEQQSNLIDWSKNDPSVPGYIQNKPIWQENIALTQNWRDDVQTIDFEIAPTNMERYIISAKYISSFAPAYFFETSQGLSHINTSINTFEGTLAYSNLALPEGPDTNKTNKLYKFIFSEGQSNWEKVVCFASNGKFYYDSIEEEYLNDSLVDIYEVTSYNGAWEQKNSLQEDQGKVERFLSNVDICVGITNNVYLYAGIPSMIEAGNPAHFMSNMIYNLNKDLANLRTSILNDTNNTSAIAVFNGTIFGYGSDSYFFVRVYQDQNTTGDLQILGFVLKSSADPNFPTGTYFTNNQDGERIGKLAISYNAIKVHENYSRLFKPIGASNIYLIDSQIIENLKFNDYSLTRELERFQAGDIIALPLGLLTSDQEG